jgi:hypothetical protein
MMNQKAVGYFNTALLENQFVVVNKFLELEFPVNDFVKKL